MITEQDLKVIEHVKSIYTKAQFDALVKLYRDEIKKQKKKRKKKKRWI